MLLVLAMSGVVAGATVLTTVTAPVTDPVVVVDTTATFEDIDGNGIDDDCQAVAAVAAPEVAAAAEAAVDLNGDGNISTSEAAQSDRTGGASCNHGGYVSFVAHENGDCTVDPTEPVADDPADETVDESQATLTKDDEFEATEPDADEPDGTETEVDACAAPAEEVVEPDAAPAVCVPVAPPVQEPVLVPSPRDHGKWVSTVAQSTATGGKNCNHGGAVSEAAKKDHAAAAAARDAAKAARAEARAAKKAERDAARAAHTAKAHGHSH